MRNGKTATDRLIEIREEEGLSQLAFAKEIGIAQSGISYIESGQRKVSKNVAVRIENRFHIGKEYLLYGDERMKEYPLDDELLDNLRSQPELCRKLHEQMRKEN